MTEEKLSFNCDVCSCFDMNMVHKQFAVYYQQTEYVCSTWHFCMPISDYIGGTSWDDYVTDEYLLRTNIIELNIYTDPGRKFVSRFFKGKWVIGDNPDGQLLSLIKDRAQL